jgi:carboxymethylenebutenolidase
METNSKWINITSANGSFGAYLSLPRGAQRPGIVLLQEIFGVNQHIRNVADQYAADGYGAGAGSVLASGRAHRTRL